MTGALVRERRSFFFSGIGAARGKCGATGGREIERVERSVCGIDEMSARDALAKLEVDGWFLTQRTQRAHSG